MVVKPITASCPITVVTLAVELSTALIDVRLATALAVGLATLIVRLVLVLILLPAMQIVGIIRAFQPITMFSAAAAPAI